MYRSILILILLFFVSCNDKEEIPYQLPENATSLLTADSIKTWKIARRYNGKTRMNMGDCFLEYRQRFRESGFVDDNNDKLRNCGPSLTATWEITISEKGNPYIKFTSDQIPDLLHQESNEKYFKIIHLSNDSLVISYAHKQFNQKRIITDYLVREDVKLSDREFHW